MRRSVVGRDRVERRAAGSRRACSRCCTSSRDACRASAAARASAARCAGSVTSPATPTTVGAGREAGDRGVEAVGPAGVDHERPAPVGERVGEGEPEALRRAGDDGDRAGDGFVSVVVLMAPPPGRRLMNKLALVLYADPEESGASSCCYAVGAVEQVSRRPHPGEVQARAAPACPSSGAARSSPPRCGC